MLASFGPAAASPLDAIAPKLPTKLPTNPNLPWHSGAPAAPPSLAPEPPKASPWSGAMPGSGAKPAPATPSVAAPAAPPAPAPTLAQPAPAPKPAAAAATQAAAPTVTQSATGILVENLTLSLGTVAYRMPRVELRGTTMSTAEVASLFDPASAEPVSARIQRLAAAEIAIPEVVAEMTGAGRQVTTYRDAILTGVKGGRIESGNTGSGSFEATVPAGTSRGSFAHMSLSDTDLGLMVALYDGTARDSTTKRIYSGFSIDGIALTDPNGGSTRIARLASGEVMARPIPGGLNGVMQTLSNAPPDLSSADPAERARYFGLMADLLQSMDLRLLEATGLEFKDGKSPDTTGRIARIAFTGAAEGRPAEARIDAVDIASESGHVRIGSIALSGISLAPILEAARNMPSGAEDPAQLRKLVPSSGTLRITDLAFEQAPGQSETGPSRFGIGMIELSAGKPVENLPSEMRLAFRDLQFPVEPKGDQEGLRTLAELGYDKIEASFGAGAGWSEPGREIMLRDIALRAPSMGSVAISAILGNVGREIFDPDTTAATIAMASATAKALDITVENGGLFERVLQRQARRESRSADDLRREWGIGAAVGIPAMLGNSPAAKAIGTAVARFVAKPGRLTIQARAKDSAGIGLADLTGTTQPAEVLNLLEVTANAQ